MTTDTKISALASGSVIQSTDLIPVVRTVAGTPTNLAATAGTAASKAASDNSQTNVASVKGAIPVGHVAVFADTGGSVQDGGALAPVATSGAYADLAGKPALSAVATSGLYSDLSGRPTLGTAAALAAGSANGVASLDSGGKVPVAQIPSSITGGLKYGGLWNATTNTPALASGAGVQGNMYKVSVAGSTALDGISNWNVGDELFFDGSAWEKLDGVPSEVISVASRTGNVVLTTADISGLGSSASLPAGTANGVATLDSTGKVPAAQIPASATIPLGNLQIVTNRNAIPNSKYQGTSGGRSDVRFETRLLHQVGNAAISCLCSVMPSAIFTNTGETAVGNAFNWESAFEITSPAMFEELTTLGAKVATVPDFAPYLKNDNTAGITIPANGTLYHRQAISVASSGLYMPNATGNAATGDSYFLSPSTSSQIPATGALTLPSGGTGSTNLAHIILGRPLTPLAAVAFLGDSIADGSNDTSSDSTGANGFIARGLASVNGSCVPSLKQTVSGQRLANISVSGAPALRSMWPWVTHLILEAVTNDVGDGRTLAQLQGYVTEILTAAKRTLGPYGKPLKTAVVCCPPRTTSTDSWATAANQTPVSGFGVGQVRDTYNAWIKSLVGLGLIDAVIDPNPYWEDQSNPGKWATTGTANANTIDGVHPNTNLHVSGAAAVNAWAATISA